MSPQPRPEAIRRELVSYGRRDGRRSRRLVTLSPAPEHTAATPTRLGADRYLIEPPRTARATSVDPDWRFDAQEHFGRVADLVVEIGSGTGEAIVAAATARPEVDHLAIEVFRPGIARTVRAAQRAGLTNLRILEGDAAHILRSALAADSVDEIRVFFPDPWPKLRHRKRRLVTADMVDWCARVLRPGGRLRMASDWADYALAVRDLGQAHPLLVNPHATGLPKDRRHASGPHVVGPNETGSNDSGPQPIQGVPDGFAARPADRPVTKFERKAVLAGRGVWEVELHKLAGG